MIRRRPGPAPDRPRRAGRRPDTSTLLLLGAAVLAVLGTTLVVVAITAQVHPPTPPPVSDPSPAEVVPVRATLYAPGLGTPLLATPWAFGPSPAGAYPARLWLGSLLPLAPDLRPPDAVPSPSGPVASEYGSAQAASSPEVRALAQAAVSPPATLRVPAIGVDTPVDSVGLTPTGELEVPAPGPTYDRAAWFRSSVTPGRQGPSVIIGHIDSRENGPSVFFELGRLRPGDRIEVTRADGFTVAFGVTDVRTVDKNAFPTAAVYGGTDGPELRLISCGGSFDYSDRNYRDNIVVFARALPA